MTGYFFQTRARTIDHLGRGQIADSPTAISELWKNAYDAYARNVALHIFDGDPEIAAVFDDGAGMDKTDFLTKWLVIGTESKVEADDELRDLRTETFGLPIRPRQGEKGIGRLSAAFLAPCTIVVSRKVDGKFVAVLVDWRLFENPYLSLSDIVVPVEEFESTEQIIPGLQAMIAIILGNIGHEEKRSDAADVGRQQLLVAAWDRFSEQERRSGRSGSTREAILRTWQNLPLDGSHLEEWPVFIGEGDHGTALFMVEIQDDLRVWLRPEDVDGKPVRDRLRETLTGFTDPFISVKSDVAAATDGSPKTRLEFDYEVLVRIGGRNTSVLRTDAIFGLDDLHGLEHHLDGVFEADGLFVGKVVAFGQDLGIQRIPPPTVMTRSDREQIGPFAFCIGTFEQDEVRSTHQGSAFAALMAKTEEFAGIAVYRDGLRVMPYGRHDADFFAIEERRSRHTGREFWAHRRSFGRVAFTRAGNPNLKDKAGREGLVDNRAKSLLRNLVVNVLRYSARTFFGTDSDLRKDLLPEITARNTAARKAAERLTKRRRTNVRGFLRERTPMLKNSLEEVKNLTDEANMSLRTKDREQAAVVLARYRDLSAARDTLKPPSMPANFKDAEAKYRVYRDDYREYLSALTEISQISAKIEAEIGSLTTEETAKSVFSRNQSLLIGRIDGYIRSLESKIDELRRYWKEQAAEDRKRYYHTNQEFLAGNIEALGLSRLLNVLDRSRLEIEDEVSTRYGAILDAVDSLRQGIDLEGAASAASDDAALMEERVREIHAVALSGIAVEIIGHELEALDAEARRHLLRLPEEVRRSSAFKLGFEAHNALADKLRALSPLKIAGYRDREVIKGIDIAKYVRSYFESTFSGNRIDFIATEVVSLGVV